ncbi:hypothetical protein JW960_25925 [candidate division KSB1 bacterium]|nr:hypothetical protein [candidate division KSB1 bacterium]
MAGLKIEDLGKIYDHNCLPGMYHHLETKKAVCDGNTSVRNTASEFLEWKGKPNSNGYGYFQRNRDLGQVFNVPGTDTIIVTAVVMRTSKGNNAVMAGAPGANMYLQLFAVRTKNGEQLRINDNGTPMGTQATHGFDMALHRCDDFVEGVEYVPLKRSENGIFPESIPPTTHHAFRTRDGKILPEQEGHLRYFRLKLTGNDVWVLEGGKRYAFILGFAEAGKNRGVALAVDSQTHLPDAPVFLRDSNNIPWWGIRREGNGKLPPTMIASPNPPKDRIEYNKLVNESLFPPNHWDILSPTSEGYPDVDTYHIFQFYLEVDKKHIIK